MTYRFFDLNTQKVVGPDGYFIDSDLNVYEEEYMYTGGMFEFLPQLKLRPSVIAEPSTGVHDNAGKMVYFGDIIKFLLGKDEYSGVVTHADATFGVFTHDGFTPLNMIMMETIKITGRLIVDLEEMKQSQREYELSLQENLSKTLAGEMIKKELEDHEAESTDLDDDSFLWHASFNEDEDKEVEDELFSIENAMTIGIASKNSAPTNETDETEDQSEPTDFVQDQEPDKTIKLQRRPLAAKTTEEVKHDEPHTPQFERKPMPIIEEPRKLILSEFNSEIFTVVNMTDTEIELRPISPHSNLFKSLIQKANGNVRLQNFYKKNAIRQMTIQEANELLKRMKEARIQWPK